MKRIRLDERNFKLLLVLVVVMFVTAGCGTLRTRNPIPENLVFKAELPELGDIRLTSDPRTADDPEGYDQKAKRIIEYSRQVASKDTKCCVRKLIILSLSGGGENGAYGAGILNGWTASNTRPKFDVVTGISTGALQAPFAYLGPDYDASLKIYSTITARDIYRKRPLGTILQQRDAVADFTPLKNLIARLFGEKELKAVAREYSRGRLLFIGTTQLDAQQVVFWNMGAIAASGHPSSLNIFRKVMLASASVPVAVPPVYFEVIADGKKYDEMHVDGGVMTQVFGIKFLKYAANTWRNNGYKVAGRVYIIRNAKLDPEWELVEPKLAKIAGRSISTMIKTQGIGDIYRAYVDSNDAGFDFNYIDIPREFKQKPEEPFDPKYMKALFNFGFQMAHEGLKLSKAPPYFTSSEN